MPSDTKRVILNIPPELHARLIELARQELRSLTAETVHLLEEAVRRRERQLQKISEGK